MKRLIIALVIGLAVSVNAQSSLPPNSGTSFRDTSILRPPNGSQVAIIEFEDLECPFCARVSTLVQDAMSRYHVPRVHHDFIIQSHTWSRTAAIYARYLEDKIAPQVAEEFRRDLFAHQQTIASQDDLIRFAQVWFQSHGQQVPPVIDPSGQLAAEVEADCALGRRLGIQHTPTIIVATAHQWIEVADPNEIYKALEIAKSQVKTQSLPTKHR